MADDTEDPDRAAILARRQRFIAIALSSLASAAACKPQPCLDVSPANNDDGKADGGKADEGGTPPQACLKVAPPQDPPPQPPPQPCLEVAPQPCLDIAVPEEAPPRPCLKIARPKDDDEAPPRPCLNVKAPPK
jgi:hypothetical protein